MSIYILTRLILLKKQTLINILLIISYGFEIIFGVMMLFFFFNVAAVNFSSDLLPNEIIDFHCKFYIMAWLIYILAMISVNYSLVFSRYLYIR